MGLIDHDKQTKNAASVQVCVCVCLSVCGLRILSHIKHQRSPESASVNETRNILLSCEWLYSVAGAEKQITDVYLRKL